MERKIGEIFEYNGEWYQRVEGDSCGECSLFTTECRSGTKSDLADKVFGECSKIRRLDSKHVIFKKLEKVGEPYAHHGVIVQNYRIRATPVIMPNEPYMYFNAISNTIAIEIKQNKENMEIDKVVMNIDDRDYLLDRLDAILHDTHCQQYKDEVCEALSKYIVTETASSLKPFDLDAAKAGKPVCTRDGRKARIICFDVKGDKPIIALIEDEIDERPCNYFANGRFYSNPNANNDADLMMLPEKKERWILLRKDDCLFDNEEVAKKNCTDDYFVAKVEWEE